MWAFDVFYSKLQNLGVPMSSIVTIILIGNVKNSSDQGARELHKPLEPQSESRCSSEGYCISYVVNPSCEIHNPLKPKSESGMGSCQTRKHILHIRGKNSVIHFQVCKNTYFKFLGGLFWSLKDSSFDVWTKKGLTLACHHRDQVHDQPSIVEQALASMGFFIPPSPFSVTSSPFILNVCFFSNSQECLPKQIKHVSVFLHIRMSLSTFTRTSFTILLSLIIDWSTSWRCMF